MLVDVPHARGVVVGADFHFGHRRRGNVALLQRDGRRARLRGRSALGLVAPPTGDRTSRYSSTAHPRRAWRGGDVDDRGRDARPPARGARDRSSHGDQRGRELGFPTANVAVPARDRACPPTASTPAWYERPDGVGAPGRDLARPPADVLRGRRRIRLLEAYLLDFDGDLYGQLAKVRFVGRLRGEERFDSVEALVEQMQAGRRRRPGRVLVA